MKCTPEEAPTPSTLSIRRRAGRRKGGAATRGRRAPCRIGDLSEHRGPARHGGAVVVLGRLQNDDDVDGHQHFQVRVIGVLLVFELDRAQKALLDNSPRGDGIFGRRRRAEPLLWSWWALRTKSPTSKSAAAARRSSLAFIGDSRRRNGRRQP